MTADGEADRKPDFPVKQLVILLACRLVEPLAVMSVVPYLLFMVQDADNGALAHDDTEATRIVTLMFAAYAGAQFATNLFWGRVSDSIGRRPVMLLSLAAVLVGTLGFGFSKSIPAMFVFRLVPGLLSGNVVVTRTMIGELTRARAFAWNQIVYQIGSIVGPMLGGYLAQPCEQFPRICKNGRGGLFSAFPFSLPNLVISVLVALSLAAGCLFMEESLDRRATTQPEPVVGDGPSEQTALLSSTATEPEPKESESQWRAVLTAPVLHMVLSYLIMGLHSICFDQIFPVFLSTHQAPSRPPAQLNGGLELSSATVGNFLSGSGIVSIALMLTIFPPLSARLGSVNGLRISLLLYPIAYFALPYLVLLPESPAWVRLLGVSVIMLIKALAAVFSFNEASVLLNVCAPSAKTLGLVNGLAQTAVAGARAIGPAAMGLFVTLGEKINCDALGWWFLAVVAAIGAVQGFWVVDAGVDDDED